jgi:formiminoglutamate deiminase
VITYWAPYVWLGDGVRPDVRIQVYGGRIVAVEAATSSVSGDQRLPGIVLPGFANTHSHAFHRALRGRTHDRGGTFWTWRERMYQVAAQLDPAGYLALATATYAEMALAGITAVGEFHYLHHQADGSPYHEPNAMGHALIEAARRAGIRITLLDACYLSADSTGRSPHPRQRRFSDPNVAAWSARVAELRSTDERHARIGVAAHSVRAVPAAALPAVAAAAGDGPLHVHVSEQPAENDECQATYGMSPTELLHRSGVLGPGATAVHATHLTGTDIAVLAETGTSISICGTTERDLADGIGPARQLADAGCPITLGTDQHAVIDMFEEARALEMDERLASGERGRFSPAQLVTAMTGHASLGWDGAGRIATGCRADLVSVRLDSARTAGCDPAQAVFAATAADVDTVIVDGRVVVRGGRHTLGDVGSLLLAAIEPICTAPA